MKLAIIYTGIFGMAWAGLMSYFILTIISILR